MLSEACEVACQQEVELRKLFSGSCESWSHLVHVEALARCCLSEAPGRVFPCETEIQMLAQVTQIELHLWHDYSRKQCPKSWKPIPDCSDTH